jgi:hypothetical protein
MVVIPDKSAGRFDAKEIKIQEEDAGCRYCLWPSKEPDVNYNVLFCRPLASGGRGRCIKDDILIAPRVAPRLWIPRTQSDDTRLINNVPTISLFEFLVMKDARMEVFAPYGPPCQMVAMVYPFWSRRDCRGSRIGRTISWSRSYGPCTETCPRFRWGMRRADKVSGTRFSHVVCA